MGEVAEDELDLKEDEQLHRILWPELYCSTCGSPIDAFGCECSGVE